MTYLDIYVETSTHGHEDPLPQALVKVSVDCNPKVTANFNSKCFGITNLRELKCKFEPIHLMNI